MLWKRVVDKRVWLALLLIGLSLIWLGPLIHRTRRRRTLESFDHILLWWTPFIGGAEYVKDCGGVNRCLITEDRSFLSDPRLRALLFYGSDLNVSDLPLPRRETDVWALFHEESPKNVPLLAFEPAISLFNFTATFSRYSDVPLTLQYLSSPGDIHDYQYFLSFGKRTSIQRKEGLAPVVYIQSICDTMTARDAYVRELARHIPVDSYGACFNNRPMPKHLTSAYLDTIFREDFYQFIARYKFIVAFENAACPDYVTEKFWRAIYTGVVPIYFGASTIRDWLPHPKAAILIDDFASPKRLADHLRHLATHEDAYNEHLGHKLESERPPITNENLLTFIYRRNALSADYVSRFECFVCEASTGGRNAVANVSHYDCSGAVRTPQMSVKVDQHAWHERMRQGKCEAQLLRDLVERNVPFDEHHFREELLKRYNAKLC